MKSIAAFCLILAPTALFADDTLRVYYSGNRQAEVDPCGCQVNQVGGLGRLATFLEKERKTLGKRPVIFVDAGDTFFVGNQVTPTRREQEILKAKVIAEAYRKLGVDAITPGERDFAAGLDVLRELEKISGSVFLAANLMDKEGKPLFKPYHVFKKSGTRVAVVGLVDPGAFEKVQGIAVKPVVEALRETLPKVKEEGAEAWILLSHQGLTIDREMAQLGTFQLVVGSHSLDPLAEPVKVGGSWIVQTAHQGQQIGVVDLARELASSAHRLIDLGKDLDQKNDITKLVDAYKEKVRELAARESANAAPPSGERPFVAHPAQCRTCHQKQYDFWAGTKHASAYLVLYAKNQHFDADCVGCHTLGFESPGGFTKAAQPILLTKPGKTGKTPFVETLMKKVFSGEKNLMPLDSRTEAERYAKLKKRYHVELDKLEKGEKISRVFLGVQCEHCHGNRHGHPDPAVPTVKRVVETSCKECHKPPHDNDFNFAERVKKAGCPLSSEKI